MDEVKMAINVVASTLQEGSSEKCKEARFR